MRAYTSAAVMALLLALLAQTSTAELLFQANDEPATVAQQRGSRGLLQSVPVYGCPNVNYPAQRTVRVTLSITGSVRAPATFGIGQKALFDAISPVFTKFRRPSIRQRQIGGPAGQFAAVRAKTFVYTFTLPLGKCGSDKKLFDNALRTAIAKLKTVRVRWAKLSQFT